MKRSILSGIIALFFLVPAHTGAVTADISGKVMTSASSPAAGCTVSIAGTSNPIATTDAQGNFALKGTTAVSYAMNTGSGLYRIIGRSIEITLPAVTKVAIDVYDLAGKRLCSVVNGQLPKGMHRIEPLSALTSAAGAMYVVTARIGDRAFSCKMTSVGILGPHIQGNSAATTVSKIVSSAIKADSLVVDCAGMPNAYVQLASLSQNVGTVTVRDMTKKPNYMFIMADDLTATDIGFMGNPDVKTPNIDTLSTQGMVFDRTFTATAMCSPIRMSLYTGIYPVRNGGYCNQGCGIKAGVKGVGTYLKALGYRVALTGKIDIVPQSGFGFTYLPGGDPNMAAIKTFVNQDTTQPYCVFVCSHYPHGPWVSGDRTPYNAATVKVDPYHVDTKEYRAAKVTYYAEIALLDNQVGSCVSIVNASKQKDNTLLMFASEQGNSFPGGKWTLWEPGINSLFIAKFPGVVRPNVHTPAMVNYIDVTPTFIEMAKGAKNTALDGLSFVPVLYGKTNKHRTIDYGVHTQRGAGTWPTPKGMPSGYAVRSVRTETHKYIWNLQYKSTYTNSLYNYAAFSGNGDVEALKSWKALAATDTFAKKIVTRYENRPEVEFYDLRTDPFEMNNIASDPAQKPLMDSLRTLLDAWMTQQGDEGIATETAAE